MSENEIKKNNSVGKPYLTPRKTIEKRQPLCYYVPDNIKG